MITETQITEWIDRVSVADLEKIHKRIIRKINLEKYYRKKTDPKTTSETDWIHLYERMHTVATIIYYYYDMNDDADLLGNLVKHHRELMEKIEILRKDPETEIYLFRITDPTNKDTLQQILPDETLRFYGKLKDVLDYGMTSE